MGQPCGCSFTIDRFNQDKQMTSPEFKGLKLPKEVIDELL